MKKILISLSIIGAVVAMAVGGTVAYFNDTETSVGNTFTAGTIDIAIDGSNPWTQSHNIGDLKPGETGYINLDITNVGQNPVNVSKNLSNWNENTGSTGYACTITGGSVSSEPECAAATANSNTDLNNVQTQIVYDLSVKVYATAGDTNLIWWQDIYTDAEGQTLSQVYPSSTTYVALGMIPVGGHMKVTQSYHFKETAGNEYQGDTLSFDITIKGEQLPQGSNGTGSVVLENKAGAPNWDILQFDGVNGTLNYQTSGNEFNYNFNATVNTANISYTLLYVGPSGNFPYSGQAVIGSGTAIGTSLLLSGSPELGMDITNGKVWLIPSSTYPSGWDHANNLYETGLINYNDTNN
ncbi:MAG: TasA family protein [bacterium]|nr:TasA family protein [bacterium]